MLSTNISSTCPQNMADSGPLTAEIGSGVLGHPSKFQRVSRIAFVTAATSLTGGQPHFARCLAVFWAGILYIFGCSCPLTELCQEQNSLYVQVLIAFSYIGSVTARHSSSGRQRNFAAWCKEWNYGTFARRGVTDIRLGGHHVGHRPTLYFFFKNIVMLCVVLCFSAYVVNKVHDNEHCSCSD